MSLRDIFLFLAILMISVDNIVYNNGTLERESNYFMIL